MQSIVSWLVVAMLAWTLPEAKREAARARYEEIARDAVAVAFDPNEKPLFAGALGRTKTATLLLSIASFESSFSEDVEAGRKRGDHGRSWCLMQVNLGSARISVDGDGWGWAKGEDGWSGKDLVEDRRKCFRAALHIARVSYRACRDLSLYTSGKCDATEPKAKHRAARAKFLLDHTPISWADSEVALTP